MNSRAIMVQRCWFERYSQVSDGGGGFTETWAAHLEGVPCRTWFRSGSEVVVGERIVKATEQVIIVPLDTDVTTNDRVSEVRDRKGVVLLSEPMGVDSVGRRRDHLELSLSLQTDS